MSGMAPSSTAASAGSRTLVALAVGAALVGGCAEPALPDAPQGEGAEQPVEADAPDPARDELLAELAALRELVASVRDELAAAQDAEDVAAARRAGDAAVAGLVDGAGDADRSIFPATTTDRGDLGSDDAMTVTLTAARDAGGELGRATLELLRDPLAGDLGAWQRDPAGVVAAIDAVVAPRSDLEALEADVLELQGEGTRALAWAFATADAPDLDRAAAFAERGVAHLDVVLSAIDAVLEEADDLDVDGDGAPVDGDDLDGDLDPDEPDVAEEAP
jgi:hypothetical protein